MRALASPPPLRGPRGPSEPNDQPITITSSSATTTICASTSSASCGTVTRPGRPPPTGGLPGDRARALDIRPARSDRDQGTSHRAVQAGNRRGGRRVASPPLVRRSRAPGRRRRCVSEDRLAGSVDENSAPGALSDKRPAPPSQSTKITEIASIRRRTLLTVQCEAPRFPFAPSTERE